MKHILKFILGRFALFAFAFDLFERTIERLGAIAHLYRQLARVMVNGAGIRKTLFGGMNIDLPVTLHNRDKVALAHNR
jgi:hypothetical protein